MVLLEYKTRAKTAKDDPEQTDVVMTFDTDRAIEVFTHAVRAYRVRSHIFALDDLFPEATKPDFIEDKSSKHVMWHFLGVFFDHTKESKDLYRDLYFMIQDYPKLLSVDGILGQGINSLEKKLRTRLAHPDSRRESGFLLDAMTHVKDIFGSDIKDILKGTTDLNVVRERLLRVKNISDKKANLFLLYMIKYKIKQFKNPNDLEMAVDFHKVRASYALGIVDFNVPSLTGQVARRLVRVAYTDFLKQNPDLPFNMIDLDDILWVVPSKVCSKSVRSPAEKSQKWLRCLRYCPFFAKYCVKPVVRNDYKGYFDFTSSIRSPDFVNLGTNKDLLLYPLSRQEVMLWPKHIRSVRYYEDTPLERHVYNNADNPQSSMFEE
ncbi:hypothetical protein KY335_00800 [Candidatus Woesearchaeota archaeon]|nr:hypothetical protein [Candidatus Woesearchaeota archaeon]